MKDSQYYLEPINSAYPENGKVADIVQTGGGYIVILHDFMNSISVARYLFPSLHEAGKAHERDTLRWGGERKTNS